MISASVGYQCPECVAAGNAATRQPVTVFGGAQIRRATVTQTLIGINAVVFLLQLVVGIDEVARQFGLWPAGISLDGQWWRMLTAAFLHGSLLHIAFNMYALWVIGPVLEAAFGHVRYLALYLLAAFGGAVATYSFAPIRTLSVGASGAIFGLMAALIVAGRSLSRDVTQVAVLLGLNIVIGFIAPGVDWRAHLGGAAVGAVVAAVFAYAPRQSRTLWQVLGVLAVVGVLVAATAWRTGEITSLVTSIIQPAAATAGDGGA